MAPRAAQRLTLNCLIWRPVDWRMTRELVRRGRAGRTRVHRVVWWCFDPSGGCEKDWGGSQMTGTYTLTRTYLLLVRWSCILTVRPETLYSQRFGVHVSCARSQRAESIEHLWNITSTAKRWLTDRTAALFFHVLWPADGFHWSSQITGRLCIPSSQHVGALAWAARRGISSGDPAIRPYE